MGAPMRGRSGHIRRANSCKAAMPCFSSSSSPLPPPPPRTVLFLPSPGRKAEGVSPAAAMLSPVLGACDTGWQSGTAEVRMGAEPPWAGIGIFSPVFCSLQEDG